MAIAFVSAGSFDGTFNAGGDAVTSSVDSGSPSDGVMVVWVQWKDTSGHTVGDTGVTYGGGTADPVAAHQDVGAHRVRAYVLKNPAAGSNTLSVDPSTGAGNAVCTVSWMTFSGVDQTTPYDNVATPTTGTDSTAEITVTSEVGDMAICLVGFRGFSPTSVAATSGFASSIRFSNVNSDLLAGGGEGTGAASVSFVATGSLGGINEWMAWGFNLNAAAGGGGGTVSPYYSNYYTRTVLGT